MNLVTNLGYFNAHETEESRFIRGRVVKEFVKSTGKSRPTFYRHRQEFLKSHGVYTHRPPIMRMPKDRYARIVNDCFKVAMVMEGFFSCSSEAAVRICQRNNQLEELHNLSISQVNRHLDSLGLSNRKRKHKKASIQWKADYSNQIVMVDASPMDQVYMNFKGEVIIDPNTLYKDTHTYQKLETENKTPVWGFYFVDVYSRAYFVHYIACKGESERTWKEAFAHFLVRKERHPMNGTIDMLYSDMGSGLTSAGLRGFLEAVCPDIQIKFHRPKNPESKGLVEGRIGGHKKICEKFLKPSDFRSIEELNQTVMNFMIYHQTKTGKFKRYVDGLQKRTRPTFQVTDKNIHDGSIGRFKRQVDAYRCISYETTRFRIPLDVPMGQEIDVFFRLDKLYTQIDGKVVELINEGPYTSDDRDSFRIPERIQRVELVKKTHKEFLKNLNTDQDYRITDAEVIESPKGEPVLTHSVIPPETMSVKEAVQYIVQETGYDEAEYVEEYIEILKRVEEKNGHIDRQLVLDMTQALLEAIK
jgi:transposase InsO family protein